MSGPTARRSRHARRLLLWVVILLLGTTAPYRFRGTEFAAQRWARLPLNPMRAALGVSRRRVVQDVTLNVLLFIPVGWLAARSRRAHETGRLRSVVVAAAGGLAVSLTIETTQLFIAGRFASSLDVVTNVTGACLGGAAGVMARRPAAGDHDTSRS